VRSQEKNMPTYEYECTRCGHVFEEFQSITADPLSECPKCGASVKRLIGAGMGIIFKGSGFYTTDYKKSSSSNSEKKPAESGSSEKKEKSESKTDSKKSEVKSGKSD
jgi:putative FmdB family regulatory protein